MQVKLKHRARRTFYADPDVVATLDGLEVTMSDYINEAIRTYRALGVPNIATAIVRLTLAIEGLEIAGMVAPTITINPEPTENERAARKMAALF